MGVYVLAIAVWLGSLSLYGAAFFFPEVHRRHDFFWSGVGAFYGLVLWFSAVQTSPTELLGHLASVVLLGWLGWQTLSLRRKRTPLDLQTPVTQDSWPTFGRQVKQWSLDLLRSTPLKRWLPEVDDDRLPGDPAIATSEIRASSLKDVDYEFVDELAPSPRQSKFAGNMGHIPEAIVLEPVKPPSSPSARAKRSPRPSAPQTAPAPKNPQGSPKPPSVRAKQQPATAGARLAGFKAWVGDVMKAKTSPKPKRAVIEIPPRPSSLAKSKRPPVPSADSIAEPSSLDPSLTVTIVDTEAIESADWGDSLRDTRAEPVPDSGMPQTSSLANRNRSIPPERQPDAEEEIIPEPQTRESPGIPDGEEEENWPDDL
ncbi:Ycf66 family protein [Leptolyngbya sp. CCNP1308]|uniref:Ycf66 family protein n=1 Tax=Leptolyngbya sp. CCNP1308 TaxID=3110255 RepID=UPI002B1F4013|nr:Ycf66 family protein [Leptolyngbya sp. CCNP1308]MEA5447699.1 Ycf66 family protein [Leptolyngbya sp. CCNP1308]